MKKKMWLLLILALILCLTACGNNGEKSKEEKEASEQEVSADADVFKMDHEVRKGFMKQKEETDSADYIPIRSVKDLQDIGDGSEESYILMCDLDMSDKEWESKRFFGVFDGNCHVISGLKKPLFSTVNGEVRNLALENIETEEGAALISRLVRGTVSNCYVTGKIKGKGGAGLIGGLEAEFSGFVNIEYCYNNAKIEGTHWGAAGGIVGGIGAQYITAPAEITIHDCENYGNVTGTENVGGIVGNVSAVSDYNPEIHLQIRDCSNYGSVKSVDTKSQRAGGIVGRLCVAKTNTENTYKNTCEIIKCANYGSVKNEPNGDMFEQNCAGICGKIDLNGKKETSAAITVNINNCLNTGEIGYGEMPYGAGICSDVEMAHGKCTIGYCLSIAEGVSISCTTPAEGNNDYRIEECYTTSSMSIAEMKDMTKNLPKFDYPAVWGITKLYNGFPHPYTEDEQEEVNHGLSTLF